MELCVKKVYCPRCQRLVQCRDETANDQVRVLCPRCGKPLWQWNGLTWRFVKEAPAPATKKAARR